MHTVALQLLLLRNVSLDNVASVKASFDRKVVKEETSRIGERAYSQLSRG